MIYYCLLCVVRKKVLSPKKEETGEKARHTGAGSLVDKMNERLPNANEHCMTMMSQFLYELKAAYYLIIRILPKKHTNEISISNELTAFVMHFHTSKITCLLILVRICLHTFSYIKSPNTVRLATAFTR